MYSENALGHKIVLDDAFDVFKISETPLPMNVNKDMWSSLIDKKPEDMYDPEYNIEAGTVLLKRIADRIEKPDAAKVGSIWHYIGRENTDEFGEYVGKVYKEKPWRIID